ncbi:hemolysin activation/secretion protein [Caulobacter ginsengisoli]|uniref:Hemolysin activation/secretion protein n=1 Tax=Caulobacter ginsengisoli TaxID=400775 RepID=A0ABU0IQU9_9CAUL|nr:ShlB/FhaC/HecB family hemolysin secretion/activation protein [Caulobacter ginsengisoli]MDQ0464390.1 hemolysin activation/secretion protein [Caulobacter ginsengisoli]
MNRLVLLTATLLAVGASARAQTPGAGAGGQLQQIPPAPPAPQSLPDIRMAPATPGPEATAPGLRILVRSLHVTGQTQFTEAQLISVARFTPGAEMDLAGLRAMAARITDFYRRQGYFVAQAYLPAQDIQDGAVTIAVVEGRYGQVTLNAAPGTPTGAGLGGLTTGDLVASGPLQRRLLLLSDLPGVQVSATLSPGQAVGTSDLRVDLSPGRRVTGSLEADNGGDRYTGEYRGGGTVNFNEPLGIGDVASLRLLTAGSGLSYARAAYQFRLGDTTLGASYARLSYHLGREFSALDGRGTADVASLFASYPLVRSRDANLRLIGSLDARDFTDRIGATNSISQRRANVFTVGLLADRRDRFWGGGWTTASADLGFGNLNIRTPVVRAIDAVTARTQGRYAKLNFEISRLQSLPGPFSLYGGLRGQLASKNLDSSEKMELGGAYGVRAYPEGEAYGDEGYLASLEGRLRLASPPGLGGHTQGFIFVDHGEVTLSKSPWVIGPNRRSLSAAGVGLGWSDDRGLSVKLSYGIKLGDEPAVSAPDRSGRIWVQISKFF